MSFFLELVVANVCVFRHKDSAVVSTLRELVAKPKKEKKRVRIFKMKVCCVLKCVCICKDRLQICRETAEHLFHWDVNGSSSTLFAFGGAQEASRRRTSYMSLHQVEKVCVTHVVEARLNSFCSVLRLAYFVTSANLLRHVASTTKWMRSRILPSRPNLLTRRTRTLTCMWS